MAEYGSFGSGLAGGYLTSSKQRHEQESLQAATDADQARLQVDRSTAMMEKTLEVMSAYRAAIARTPPGEQKQRLENQYSATRQAALVLNNQLKTGTNGSIDFSSAIAAGGEQALAEPSPILQTKEGITTEALARSGGENLHTFKKGKKFLSSGKDLIVVDLDVDDPTAEVIHTGSADQTNVEKLQSYRAKLVAADPNDPQIEAVDNAIKKETTFKPAAGDALAIQQLQDYRATFPDGDPRIPAVDAAIEKLTTHKPTAPPKTSQYIAGPKTPKDLPGTIQRDSSNRVDMDYVEKHGYIKTSTVQQTTAAVEGGYETKAKRDAAREQTDLFNLGEKMLDDLIGHLKTDPSAGGLEGAFRRIAQKVSRGLGSLSPRANVPFADNVREWIDRSVEANEWDATEAMELRDTYLDDPDLSEMEVLENSLAMIYARVLNPKDRLLKDQLDIARQMVKIVGFAPGSWDAKGAIERLNRVRGDLVSRRDAIAKRLGETPAATTTTTSAGPTTLNFDSDGNLID
tara:strand:+ start:188 stop:1735 length:1548 start_codon:yes stop_codon:yes gene_type:complete